MKQVLILFALGFVFNAALAQDEIPLVKSHEVLEESKTLISEGKYEDAIKQLSTVNINDTNYTSVLYKMAMAYNFNKNYNKAIEICAEAIKHPYHNKADFFNLYALSVSESGDSVKALEVYERAIAEYPFNFRLHMNKGETLIKLKRYDEAVKSLTKAAELNIVNPWVHYKLGRTYANAGQIIPATLAYGMYLMLENNTETSFNTYKELTSIFLNEFEPKKPISLTNKQERFDQLSELVKSKISINPKFKNKTKLFNVYTNTWQLILEQLPTIKAENEFLDNFYIKFYSEAMASGNLEPLLFYMLYTVNFDEVQRFNKSESNKTKFTQWAYPTLVEKRKKREFTIDNTTQVYDCEYYNDGNLYAFGINQSSTEYKPKGKWRFLNENGGTLAIRNYADNSETNGESVWYHDNGQLKTIANFKDNKKNGNYKHYNEKGILLLDANFVDDEFDGEAVSYYATGQLKNKTNYKKGKKEGTETIYFTNGNIKSVTNYKDALYDGKHESFFIDGTTELLMNYTADKPTGEYKKFHFNGKIATKGNLINGEETGKWVYYHDNGKLEKEIEFKAGLIVGAEKIYDEEGKLSEEKLYNEKGKLEGEEKSYTKNGKIYSVSIFSNGKLKYMKNLDSTGKVTEEYKLTKKQNVKARNENFKVSAEGYWEEMTKNGEWKFYNEYGNISSICNYKNGNPHGDYKNFYLSGSVNEKVSYEDGELHGYYRKYYENGKLNLEGWYQFGKKEGVWKSYHLTGKIAKEEFYLDGNTTGNIKDYNFNGKIESNYQFFGDILEEITNYDTLGNVLSVDKFNKGDGKLTSYLIKDKPHLKAEYKGSLRNGDFVWYFANGKIESKTTYKGGLRTGFQETFYPNGKKSNEGNWKYGDRNGLWVYRNNNVTNSINRILNYKYDELDSTSVWFHPNGKKELVTNYYNGEKEGISTIYSENDEYMYEKIYHKGKIVAYAYMKNGAKVTVNLPNGEGNLKAYFSNGTLIADENYKNGYPHGKKTLYFPNGKVYLESNCEYNNYTGARKEFYSNGNLKENENYYFDEMHGTCLYYHENGKLEREEQYVYGTKHGTFKYYDTTGKIINTTVYQYDNPLN